MDTNEQEFLTLFKQAQHTHFDLRSFRKVFVKAAWKVYSEVERKPIGSSRFQTVIVALFDGLFTYGEKDIDDVLKNIREITKKPDVMERFLSDTFYIFLNHYIKVLYGKTGGWEKLIRFTTAVEQFIAYGVQRIHDESLFIFEDALIDTLEALRQQDQEIRVLNTYYGVPIQFPAKIIHTDSQSVIIRTRPIQLSAAMLQKGIYILRNKALKYDIFASVTAVNVDGVQCLKLSRFDQLETSLFHRQNIRVHPARPYRIRIASQSQEFPFQLFDLSLGGIAATSDHSFPIAQYDTVNLFLPMEITGQSAPLKGHLVYKSSFEGGYKYHFRVELTPQQESDIARYITRREHEIIKMLRDTID